MSSFPSLITSVGVEFEVENFLPNNLPRNLQEFFTATHDASCESPALLLNCGLLTSPANESFTGRNITIGGELVSSILDTEDGSYRLILEDLTRYAIENGESYESFRAGMHVHICFSNANLRMLKSTLRIWRYLEDVFFYIGGMGYEFRGCRNDSTYCRPLTRNGPIAVPYRGKYAESVNLNDILKSKTISEFWDRWGDLPNQGDGNRYFPVRYHAFNVSPAHRRGTIEYRIFNKSVNPLYLFSAIEFCKAVSELALRYGYEDLQELGLLQENSIYDERSKEEIFRTLLKISEICRLDSRVLSILVKIIERTPAIHLSNERIVSHLPSVRSHWENSSYSPKIIPAEQLKRPNFVDLHVLRGER